MKTTVMCNVYYTKSKRQFSPDQPTLKDKTNWVHGSINEDDVYWVVTGVPSFPTLNKLFINYTNVFSSYS